MRNGRPGFGQQEGREALGSGPALQLERQAFLTAALGQEGVKAGVSQRRLSSSLGSGGITLGSECVRFESLARPGGGDVSGPWDS